MKTTHSESVAQARTHHTLGGETAQILVPRAKGVTVKPCAEAHGSGHSNAARTHELLTPGIEKRGREREIQMERIPPGGATNAVQHFRKVPVCFEPANVLFRGLIGRGGPQRC